jgi:septum formation protein
MPQLVLASTSPYRRQLLERLRVPFAWAAPGVDEQSQKTSGQGPMEIACGLARAKAERVFEAYPDALVVGSDQVATLDGQRLDKPGSADRAIDQLRRLRGHQHQLLTAVAIRHPGGLAEFVDVTRLCMRDLDDGEIDRYVAADQPLDCAGSYKIESLGISLFAAIDSEDQTAIQGLPLLRLSAELRQLGLRLP